MVLCLKNVSMLGGLLFYLGQKRQLAHARRAKEKMQ
jgi:hypothetical protein